MSLWDQTLAFGFLPDVDRKEVTEALPKRTRTAVALPEVDASKLTVACACVFAVYSKCEGDDAVLILDGGEASAPLAALNPFATMQEQPLRDVVRALASLKPEDTEARKKLSASLRSAPKHVPSNALAGTSAILLESTVRQLSDAACVRCFDVVWVLDGANVSLLYNAALYADVTMDDRLEMLKLICNGFALDRKISDLDALTPSMKQRLLVDWQAPRISPEVYRRTLPDIFRDSAERVGADKTAVLDPNSGVEFTYGEMMAKAVIVAKRLHAALPAAKDRWGIDATVGIHVPRCGEWYVLMLGVHLAGGAYLSLDPDFPPDRLLFALEDSDAVCLITTPQLDGSLGFKGKSFVLGDMLKDPTEEESTMEFTPHAKPDTPAYLIYTSGSTGKPKGVCVEQLNVVNFVESERILFGLDDTSRVLQGFSTSFDASVEEIWLAFASGGTLIVVQKAVMQDVEQLGELAKATKATVLSTVPTLLATIDPAYLASVELVIAGAEACGRDVVRAYATGGKRRFCNSYGPTEATVACMADFCSPNLPVTIGRPQPGYFACILNSKGELVPPGVPGELCMSGPSITRGYVNRDELTREKFVECAFETPNLPDDPTYRRMYHTGDLTRWNSRGRVEFLGRIDSQVKLRGFRIEVGEIETHLASFPGVRSAIVHLVNDNGHQFLCGYLLCEDALKESFQETAFRDYLKDKLPTYMIPTRFCTIDVVPRSPAGKLDRKQLAPPPPIQHAAAEDKVAPSSDTERFLQAIWAELFPGQTIGTTDNFFELGGHSLLAGKAASKVRHAGYEGFGIRVMFSHPTIREAAELLDAMGKSTTSGDNAPPAALPDRFQPSMLRRVLFAIVQLFIFFFSVTLQWAYLFVFFFYAYGENHKSIEDAVQGATIGYVVILGFAMQAFYFGINLIIGFVLIPLLKWLLLWRAVEGDYSIWSVYFLRWWCVRAIGNQSGSFLLWGTYLYNIQLWLNGADIGTSVVITAPILDPDLVSIGDDTFVGDNAMLATSEVVDSMLQLRRITIGSCCSVGARAALRGGSEMEAESVIAPLTLLREGVVVPSGERWAGSPGQKVGYAPPLSRLVGGDDMDSVALKNPQSPTGARSVNAEYSEELLESVAFRMNFPMRFCVGVLQLMFYTVLSFIATNILGVITFGAWVACDELAARDELWYAALYIPLAPFITGVIMIAQHLLLAMVRYMAFPCRARPGFYPVDGLLFQRKLLLDMVCRTSLLFAHPMYGTIFTQYWLRLMGCDVGKNVECSNLYGYTPGITHFNSECFVADFVGVNPPDVFRGVMRLDHVEVQSRAFVGNGAVLPPGTTIGEKSLLGLTSCPVGDVEPGATCIGSPAFSIPRRTSADTVDQAKTFQPPTILVVRRVLWEAFRCVMPATFITMSAVFAFVVAAAIFYSDQRLIGHEGKDARIGIYVALVALFIVTIPLFNVMFAVLTKYLIIGSHHAEEHPLWSAGVWRSEFVVDVVTVLSLGGAINLFRGTCFLPALFRMLGAKIGSDVYLDTMYLTEPDMVTLEDGVCVNYNCTLQTHLFEDRVMKMDRMHIGKRTSIGPFSIVLYNTEVGRGSTVGPLSLIMKGESLPANTHWEGIPAQRRNAPAIMTDQRNIVVVAEDPKERNPIPDTKSAAESSRILSTRTVAETPREAAEHPTVSLEPACAWLSRAN